jgi:hypothetical protein
LMIVQVAKDDRSLRVLVVGKVKYNINIWYMYTVIVHTVYPLTAIPRVKTYSKSRF